MKNFLAVTLLLTAAAACAAHSANRWRKDDRGVLLSIARAPIQARAWKNPYEEQPEALEAGEKLFHQHCAECHGENARGIGRAANLRLPDVQNATPGELAWFLRNGNLAAGMPSWSGLPPERRWQIAAYVKSLR
ncbi:MAG: c-type cytochrome [Candidatus Acidiferrales bacterium]